MATECSFPTIPRWNSFWYGSGSRGSGRTPCSSLWARDIVMTTELLTLLQFTDGLFPAGGFAHSFGLETYTQDGHVHDRATLEAFIIAHLEGATGPCDAVAVASAVRRAAAGDL